MTRARLARLIASLAAAAVLPAAAFKLQALGPAPDPARDADASPQALAFMRHFTSDVHERITYEAYRKAGVKLPDGVIAGVRWNDNPPAIRIGALFGACNSPQGTLEEGLDCWTSTLRFDRFAWETISRRDKSIAPLRSHFGDMQFLHAMAAGAGEPASETREKALRWAEFAYRVARGEIAPRARMYDLRRRDGPLEPATAAWLHELFGAPEKRLWSVQDLFLPRAGDPKRVAFGSLLHVVEDSYSAAHVRRAAARLQPNGCPSYDAADAVLEFHTYVGQDTERHGLCDDAPDWLGTPRDASPIDALAEIVRAYEDGREWAHVKAILERTVFRLDNPGAPARPGACFEAREDPLAAPTGGPALAALEPGCLAEAKR